MEEEKSTLVLNSENWSKWSSKMLAGFKQIGAGEWIKEEKKIEDFANVQKEKFRKTALAVNLMLQRATIGDDNELVRTEDPEAISAAWNKLVNKYEGDKNQKLLRAFDDMILEQFKGADLVDEYVGRFNSCAKTIKENVGTIDELIKLIVVSNMLRSLPKEFDSVKQAVREKIEENSLADLTSEIEIGVLELVLKELKYEEHLLVLQ